MRLCKVGYDIERLFNRDELEAMYIMEGKTPSEAKILAESLCREINCMVSKEKYSWRKCRKSEIVGVDIDSYEEPDVY